MNPDQKDLHEEISAQNKEGENAFDAEPIITRKPYKPAAPARRYHEQPWSITPEVYTEKELQRQCSMRKSTITGAIITAVIMLIPVCVILFAALAVHDPSNSASGFVTTVFAVFGLIVGGIILRTAYTEIEKATEEIQTLQESYRRNTRKGRHREF